MMEFDSYDRKILFQMTWADIALAAMLDRVMLHHAEALENFPTLKDHMIKINESPNIKTWMENRPKTKV